MKLNQDSLLTSSTEVESSVDPTQLLQTRLFPPSSIDQTFDLEKFNLNNSAIDSNVLNQLEYISGNSSRWLSDLGFTPAQSDDFKSSFQFNRDKLTQSQLTLLGQILDRSRFFELTARIELGIDDQKIGKNLKAALLGSVWGLINAIQSPMNSDEFDHFASYSPKEVDLNITSNFEKAYQQNPTLQNLVRDEFLNLVSAQARIFLANSIELAAPLINQKSTPSINADLEELFNSGKTSSIFADRIALRSLAVQMRDYVFGKENAPGEEIDRRYIKLAAITGIAGAAAASFYSYSILADRLSQVTTPWALPSVVAISSLMGLALGSLPMLRTGLKRLKERVDNIFSFVQNSDIRLSQDRYAVHRTDDKLLLKEFRDRLANEVARFYPIELKSLSNLAIDLPTYGKVELSQARILEPALGRIVDSLEELAETSLFDKTLSVKQMMVLHDSLTATVSKIPKGDLRNWISILEQSLGRRIDQLLPNKDELNSRPKIPIDLMRKLVEVHWIQRGIELGKIDYSDANLMLAAIIKNQGKHLKSELVRTQHPLLYELEAHFSGMTGDDKAIDRLMFPRSANLEISNFALLDGTIRALHWQALKEIGHEAV